MNKLREGLRKGMTQFYGVIADFISLVVILKVAVVSRRCYTALILRVCLQWNGIVILTRFSKACFTIIRG